MEPIIATTTGADPYGLVKIKDADMAGHDYNPHANLELIKKVTLFIGCVIWETYNKQNKHIYFKDKP